MASAIRCYARCVGLLLGGATAGCVPFYQPTLARAPLVRHRGETAVSGSCFLSETGQVAVAWSPVEHVRLSAAGSSGRQGEATDSTYSYLRGRQYEVGAGYYFAVSEGRGVVELGGSFGQGRSFAHGNISPGLLVPLAGPGSGSTTSWHGLSEQWGRYTTLAGQVGALWDTEDALSRQYGLLLRVSHARFTRLAVNDVEMVRPASWYVEPAWLVRTRGQGLRVEAQAGFAMALGPAADKSVFFAARPRVGVSLLAYPTMIFRKFKAR